jgi:hypothetical protein
LFSILWRDFDRRPGLYLWQVRVLAPVAILIFAMGAFLLFVEYLLP